MADSSPIITAFVFGILGVILLGVISGLVLTKTQLTAVSNETLSIAGARLAGGTLNSTYQLQIANYPTSWELDTTDCLVTGFVLRNQTGHTMTATTDYNFDTKYGNLTLVNSANLNKTGNSTFVSYNYCGDDYISQGFGRRIFNLVPGILALFIVVGFIGFLYYYVRLFEKSSA